MAPWFRRVKVGDRLQPKPLWNRTERPGGHLSAWAEVLAITEARCQSGVMFTVKTKSGQQRTLDAGWFLNPYGESA